MCSRDFGRAREIWSVLEEVEMGSGWCSEANEEGKEDESRRSRKELSGSAGGGEAGGGSQRFPLDRSKVNILLCDNDAEGSQEAFQLLCNLSYQVTSVKSARQAIDMLNAQGSEIDIILAEVNLPVAKGLKMLKYITRNNKLRRIPIIMMSAQDEVSVVIKCLRNGAVDYLVKPLRTNELLNLWTHMWRRRRMLGLPDKDVFSHDIELCLSDPSDGNTNSTTIISDDTDEKTNKEVNPEISVKKHIEHVSMSAAAPSHDHSMEEGLNVPRVGGFVGALPSFPKKATIKIGESSAFLTYVKSTPLKTSHINVNGMAAPKFQNLGESFPYSDAQRCNGKVPLEDQRVEDQRFTGEETHGPSNLQMTSEYPVLCLPSNSAQPQLRNGQVDVSTMFSVPFYYPGVEQNVFPSSTQMFHGSLNDVQAHKSPAVLPHYNILSQCHPIPVMPAFPYNYLLGPNIQSNNMATQHVWPSKTGSSAADAKSGRTERRAAALMKFRQKRKDRCFDKKIRYVNRKHLAEKRPRVRGQFVRQASNIDLNQNGFVSGGESEDEDDDDEDDEPTTKELELASSPEHNVSEN